MRVTVQENLGLRRTWRRDVDQEKTSSPALESKRSRKVEAVIIVAKHRLHRRPNPPHVLKRGCIAEIAQVPNLISPPQIRQNPSRESPVRVGNHRDANHPDTITTLDSELKARNHVPVPRRRIPALDVCRSTGEMDPMLISETLNAKLNEQVGCEFAASIQYTAIAAHFDSESLPYLARHFYKQAAEEHAHAMKFIKFLVDAGGCVEIPVIEKPVSKFSLTEDAVKLSLEQEIKVTNLINALMDLALKENNHIASTFLQWFVTEQLEEVSSMDQLLRIVQRAGEGNLLAIEQYLAGTSAVGGSKEGSEE